MTQLFRVVDNQLRKVESGTLARESMIEDWVANDLSLVGLEAALIGRQVITGHNQRIDLLAINEAGDLIIIEMKRDRTPREIVAQVLDYASWVATLTTQGVHDLTREYNDRSLAEIFRDRFGTALPETLNRAHQMLIVASAFDEASERIVKYLSEVHDVGINASFFSVFGRDSDLWITTDFLLDQDEVTDRAVKKTRGPFTGFYYITGGAEEDRAWEPMRRNGFFSAHGGRYYTDQLDRLSIGDKVFYYQKKNGYLGYGVVTKEKTAATEFVLVDGRKLTDVADDYYLTENKDNPDSACYVVGIDWKKTVPITDAKSFAGIFANQAIACKIYQHETADFLCREFAIDEGKE